MSRQLEIEEEAICEDYNNSLIDTKEYNRQMRYLYRSYSDAAEESAQDAYDREMERW